MIIENEEVVNRYESSPITNKYVLVIDDDPSVGMILSQTFKNFHLVAAYSLAEARDKLENYSFSAIFFDIELPDGDGLDLLAELTQQKFFNSIPLFVLSSHSEMPNKLTAFSLGVDDFIAKPFSPIEVLARLQSKIQKFRVLNDHQAQIKISNALLDFDRRAVYSLIHGTEINLHLTHYEFMIFALLARTPGKVFSREDVLTEVWGETIVSARGIDSHIARIRSKLSTTNVKINTIKGAGYCILVE